MHYLLWNGREFSLTNNRYRSQSSFLCAKTKAVLKYRFVPLNGAEKILPYRLIIMYLYAI